jgi:hypothetical protein
VEPDSRKRRIALAVIGMALGIAVMIVGYGVLRARDASPGVGWIRVGTTQQLDQARVTFVASIPAFVVATPEGLIGLYAKSPHLGEPVQYCASSGYFEDPMHGSKFDGVGDYALGPAPRGLDRLQVRTVGNNLWIDPQDHVLGAPRGQPRASRPTGPFCTAQQ